MSSLLNDGIVLFHLGVFLCGCRTAPNDTAPPMDTDVATDAAPTITLLSPTATHRYYTNVGVVFEATVIDTDTVAADLSAQWSSNLDGNLFDYLWVQPDGIIAGERVLTAGGHVLTLVVSDSGGNQDAASVAITVRPPNSPPTCTITAPPTDSSHYLGEPITLAGTALDVDVPSEWLVATWSSDLDGELDSASAPASGAVSLTTDALSLGTHVITLSVSDEVGATCLANHTLNVRTNTAPPSPLVSLQPEYPTTTDALVASVEILPDTDGPESVSTTTRWLENGTLLDGHANNTLASTVTVKGNTYTVQVTPSDGLDEGEPGLDSVTIANSAPVGGSVIIGPEGGLSTLSSVSCSLATASDPDEDPVSVTFQWLNDTSSSVLGTSSILELTPYDVAPGDVLSCVATLDDGDGGVSTVSGSRTIATFEVDRPATDSPPAHASWRYGGGVGYPDTVDPAWRNVTIVETTSQLAAALAGSSAGSIVYVADHAVLDLTGASLCIPAGVWLAGGRGQAGEPGGTLTRTDATTTPMLKACGDDVRITGLRIIGRDPNQCPDEYPDECTGAATADDGSCKQCTSPGVGIKIDGYDALEIDNCELAAWAFSATRFQNTLSSSVHHNDIHHNQRQGLGYGVVLKGADPVQIDIAFNRFDYNRHSIAGGGHPGQDYWAHDNLVLEHANGHVFDMHGVDEGTGSGEEWAGGWIEIWNNSVFVDDEYTLVVRGIPQHGSWLYGNCLTKWYSFTAAKQRLFYGNFYLDEDPSAAAASNSYGNDPDECETERWCMASGGTGPWSYGATSNVRTEDLRFGDFDGDGLTDAFYSTGSQWKWSKSGTSAWAVLNTSSYTAADLGFADFNGDGQTDVFLADGEKWRFSSAGSASWGILRYSTVQDEEVRFGDFDADGTSDVFWPDGAQWKVSYSGTSSWYSLKSSAIQLDQLLLGDFDGNGRTDVLRMTGTQWNIAKDGTGSWETRKTSAIEAHQVLVGDVDGDGSDDVIYPSYNRIYVSYSASEAWQTLRIASEDVGSLSMGEFDGDGRQDVFRAGCF